MPKLKPGRPRDQARKPEHVPDRERVWRQPRTGLLLVDDEKAFAEALAFRLRTRGFSVLTAGGAEEALALADTPDLEIVLLDLNLPGMHGLELLRRFKAGRPELEIILLTGEADFNLAATGMRRGAGDYLIKPVDFDVLLESIAKARTRAGEHKERLRAAEAGKLVALGVLAAGVGHEINNPLQIILQRSEWLEELLADAAAGRADFAEMAKSAEVIKHQALRAGEITAQLLELAGHSRSGKASAMLPGLAEKVVGRLAQRAGELSTRILVDIPGDLPPLPCLPSDLETVLAHLLRNALDAIEALLLRQKGPGATGRAASGGMAGLIKIRGRMQGELVRISVRDNGEGVAPDLRDRIFEPFFSTRPLGRGTGLGLTVCHSIVSALGGSIRCARGDGREPEEAAPAVRDTAEQGPGGALFIVEFPAFGGSAS
ncbi:response regulator [Desulfovibrio sp. OttesenSCG-928-A18]|nr:response regulator [Desulfovibrio sp. OttesenSCG-928-A18]